jgi:hypothetical protein
VACPLTFLMVGKRWTFATAWLPSRGAVQLPLLAADSGSELGCSVARVRCPRGTPEGEELSTGGWGQQTVSSPSGNVEQVPWSKSALGLLNFGAAWAATVTSSPCSAL